jgi:predicted ATPase
MYELELTSIHDSSINVNLADTGSGVAQVVPLVVQEAMHVISPVIRPTVYVIEQPELHLHPAAHAALAELFFKGLSANRRFLIETHSENLILRLRRYVADQELKASDLALYFVDQSRGAATLRRIEVDDLGNVQDWPTGVFSEDLAQTKKLLRAQLAQAAD